MVLLIVQKLHRAHFPLIYGNIEKIVIIVISRESAHIHESAHSLNLVNFYFLFFFKSNSQIRPPSDNWFHSTWAPMGGFPRDYGTPSYRTYTQ